MRMPASIPQMLLISSALVLLSFTNNEGHAFTVSPTSIHYRRHNVVHPTAPTRFVSARSSAGTTTPSSSRLYALPDIGSMKVGDIRQELESYGISTRSFLEKKEFIQALEQARADGKIPVNNGKTQSNGTSRPNANGSSASSKKSTSSAKSKTAGTPRSERIKLELEKGQAMKVSELKKKLADMGISTKSFFEKSEFVKAYAEAMVDGPKHGSSKAQQEEYDASYRDVVMQKFDNVQQRMLSGTVIDIKLK